MKIRVVSLKVDGSGDSHLETAVNAAAEKLERDEGGAEFVQIVITPSGGNVKYAAVFLTP